MHVARPYPGQILALNPSGDSLPFATSEQWHQQVKIGVAVACEGEWSETAGIGVDAKFFFQLADKGKFGRLAGFDLAAWEFPEAGEGFAFGALGQKNAAIGVYQGDCGDEDDFQGWTFAGGESWGPAPRPPGYLGQNEI